jgi:hypothetical protein
MATARTMSILLITACTFDVFAQSPRTPIAVSVHVDAADAELRNYLTSIIGSELRKLGDVEAVSTSEYSNFGIYVNAVLMEAKSFGMSLVVTVNFQCGDLPVTDFRQQFVIGGTFENGRTQIARTIAAIDSQNLNELRRMRREKSRQ